MLPTLSMQEYDDTIHPDILPNIKIHIHTLWNISSNVYLRAQEESPAGANQRKIRPVNYYNHHSPAPEG